MIAELPLERAFLLPGYAACIRAGRSSGACTECAMGGVETRWSKRFVSPETSPYAERVLQSLLAMAREDREGSPYTILYEYEFATGHTRREWIPPTAGCERCTHEPVPRQIALLGADVIDVFTAGAESRFFFKTVTGQRIAGKGVQAAGAGSTRAIAEVKAVGEYLERSASAFPQGSRRFGTYRDLDLPSPHPSRYAIYSERQYATQGFGYAPFTEDSSISWARGVNFATGEAAYVPAQFCTFPYACDAPGEQYLSEWTTTGISFGPTRMFAVEGAILEVLERDALAISWLNRRSARRIIDTPFDRHGPPGWDIRYYDMSVDVRTPVILAVTVCTSPDAPLFTMGTGCAIDPHEAFEKAHNEMLMCIEHAHLLRLYREPVKELSQIRSFEDHSAYYAFGERRLLKPLGFLLNDGPVVSYRDWSNEPWLRTLDEVVANLQARDLETIVLELTPPWMDGIGHIVRAVIPGTQAIHADHARPYLGGTRLQNVPAAVGFETFDLAKGIVPHALP